LLERRKGAERALTTVVATCYLLGVSTRRMDKLVETLGITSLSKSQVSVMAKETRHHGRGVPHPAAGWRAAHVRRR
jgi:transposase-like protein